MSPTGMQEGGYLSIKSVGFYPLSRPFPIFRKFPGHFESESLDFLHCLLPFPLPSVSNQPQKGCLYFYFLINSNKKIKILIEKLKQTFPNPLPKHPPKQNKAKINSPKTLLFVEEILHVSCTSEIMLARDTHKFYKGLS